MVRNRIRISRIRAGFSLIELVAALVISVLLLGAIFGLSQRMAKHRNELQKLHPYEPWKSRLSEQMNTDYENCFSFLVRPSEVALLTCRSSDDITGRSSQMPTLVVYRITEVGKRPVLVRIEKKLVENSEQATNQTLMAAEILRFDLVKQLETDIPPPVVVLKVKTISPKQEIQFPITLVRHGAIQQ